MFTIDTFTIFCPSDGQRFYSFAGRESKRQVAGFEVETSPDNVSREILSKTL